MCGVLRGQEDVRGRAATAVNRGDKSGLQPGGPGDEGQQEAAGLERHAARPQDVGDRRLRSCWRPAHHEEALGPGGPAQRLQQSGPDPHQSGR